MHKTSSERRILVVDDYPDAAELLLMLLQIEGYEVRMAFDEGSGLMEMSEFHPHVICLEQHMPFLSGAEFAREVRKSDHSREAHLIAVTTLDDYQTRRNIAAAGFNASFCKPLDFENFFAHLRSVFEQLNPVKERA